MPLEDDPTAETSAAVEPSPLATAGDGDAADFPPAPPFEDSFPFPFPMLLLLLKTCVTLSMTLPLMMIPILEAALRGDEEAAEAAAEWAAEGGGAAWGGPDPPAASAAAASLFPLSLSASAAAAADAADSGEGRELGCCLGGCGGGAAGVAGLLRLNPSEVILREISFEARSTTPGALGAVALLAIGAVLLLPPLDEVVVAPAGFPLFIVLSGRRVNRVNPPSAATDEMQSHRNRV